MHDQGLFLLGEASSLSVALYFLGNSGEIYCIAGNFGKHYISPLVLAKFKFGDLNA